MNKQGTENREFTEVVPFLCPVFRSVRVSGRRDIMVASTKTSLAVLLIVLDSTFAAPAAMVIQEPDDVVMAQGCRLHLRAARGHA